MITREIEIVNKLGLHARAAAKFVALASGFDCRIDVERNGHRINGKSIMGLMMLAAAKDTTIEIFTDGNDEEQALDALEALINNRFDEAE